MNGQKCSNIPMLKPTEIAAWVGAVTGLSALLWDFYKWKTAGPKLTISISTGMKMTQDRDKDATYVIAHVRNNGTTATTLTTMALATYRSWLARVRMKHTKAFVVPKPLHAEPLPFKLNVGEQWTGIVKQTAELDALIGTGKLWCQIYHSWSGRPVFAPIRKHNKTS